MKDLIIIGAGPAGLTAALYAARAGLSILVLEKNIYGGQVAITSEIENYPAIERISGVDFSMNIYNQVINQGVEILLEEAKEVNFEGEVKTVKTNLNKYESKSIIIANGVKRRKLLCKGEEEFLGRGVSYCATCDGAFFKGKDVAIVGAGNTALEDALFLSNICKSVTIIVRKDKVKGEKKLFEAIQKKGNINVIYNTVVNEIGGKDNKVSFLKTLNTTTNKEKILNVSAIFIAIGLEPDNRIFSGSIDIDENGYIISNEDCRTKIPGVFVAGDTRTKYLRQIVTAQSDGAIAVSRVSEYLNSK